MYFPAEDPPLELPQTSEPWELPNSTMSSEHISTLEKALFDSEVRYSEQQNHSSVGHFHKDCFVVLETLGLNLWNLEDMYFDILSFN